MEDGELEAEGTAKKLLQHFLLSECKITMLVRLNGGVVTSRERRKKLMFSNSLLAPSISIKVVPSIHTLISTQREPFIALWMDFNE